jgi:hypothetical protein
MANPNIVSVTSIYGKTDFAVVSTTASNIVVNSASSGKIYKVNSLIISNVDGANTSNITISINRSGTDYKVSHNISVPAGASLVALSKDASVYMQEGDYMRVTAGANNHLHAVCSYEEIS